jgi:hypothetical protein
MSLIMRWQSGPIRHARLENSFQIDVDALISEGGSHVVSWDLDSGHMAMSAAAIISTTISSKSRGRPYPRGSSGNFLGVHTDPASGR